MLAELLFQFIEFAVRTAVLLGLLWVMIKLQRFNRKYEYRFRRLLLAAALASALDMIPHAGHFLAFPVLWVGVKKVTRADYVETLLTVAVSGALVFSGNRLLLKPLMGDVRIRVEKIRPLEILARALPRKKAAPAIVPGTNPPALRTNLPALQTNVPTPPTAGTNPPHADLRPGTGTIPPTNLPAAGTNPPAPAAPTNAVAPPPSKPAENMVKYISVKGVTRNGPNSAVTIQAGTKDYTVFLEEASLMQTPAGPVSVRFAELGTNTLTLEINGESVKYQIH